MQISDFTIEKLDNENYVVKAKGIYQDIDYVNGGFIITQQRAEEIRDLIIRQNTPSLEEIKINKINEMNSACQNAIIKTFKSNSYDETTIEDYACELTDQSRINGLVTIAQLRLSNLTTEPINYYKNKEADKCIEWQPKNMLDLGLDLKRHIEKNTNRYEDLKIYISSLNSVEEVQKITWDTVISTTSTT